jgi:hypothetical protein
LNQYLLAVCANDRTQVDQPDDAPSIGRGRVLSDELHVRGKPLQFINLSRTQPSTGCSLDFSQFPPQPYQQSFRVIPLRCMHGGFFLGHVVTIGLEFCESLDVHAQPALTTRNLAFNCPTAVIAPPVIMPSALASRR